MGSSLVLSSLSPRLSAASPSSHLLRTLLPHCKPSSSTFPARRLSFSPVVAMASSPPQPQVAGSEDSGALDIFQLIKKHQVAGSEDSGALDIFQLIKKHQEAAARLPPFDEVKTVINYSTRGMISTFSRDHSGYPSGSLIDFACNEDGTPILAVSSLAVHTKNLLENPKCSLLVARDPDDRTDLVITLYGDAIPVSKNDREQARSAYLRRHPDAFWVDFGDFQFVNIKPKAIRYVSGVATALLGSGELEPEEYKVAKVDPIYRFSKAITSHMNKDHEVDTKAIVQYSTSVEVKSAYMLDIDSLGFNVKAGLQGSTMKLRIPFPRRAEDRKDVKTLIVEMLQAARASN